MTKPTIKSAEATLTYHRALGARWLAHPDAYWQAGMKACDIDNASYRVIALDLWNGDPVWGVYDHAPQSRTSPLPLEPIDPVPDTTDAATVGCMLDWVRDLWGSKRVYAEGFVIGADPVRWQVVADRSHVLGRGDSEPEALIEAAERIASAAKPQG